MNWTQCKPLYDIWGSFEKRFHENNDAHALTAWQSLSLSTPSEEWLQSLSGFCAQSVSEETVLAFIAHSWSALGEALCSQRDWVLNGQINPTTQRVEEALWTILAQSARATLQMVSDQQLEKMICPGATAEQLLEMILPAPFFNGFFSALQYMRANPIPPNPSVVYSASDFPWDQLDHLSDHIIEVTGVGMGIDTQLLTQNLESLTQMVGSLKKAITPTQLAQMNWATLNLLKPRLGKSLMGSHTGITNAIDVYVSEDHMVSVVDIFAHEWGHALEFQVGHSNCAFSPDPRLSSIQAPLEQLVTAIFNTPQCPIAAPQVRQDLKEELVWNVAVHCHKTSHLPFKEAQKVAEDVWNKAMNGESVRQAMSIHHLPDQQSAEEYAQDAMDAYAYFTQLLDEGKSVWLSFSAVMDRLNEIHTKWSHIHPHTPVEPGYWSNPREIFARAMEVALPQALSSGPRPRIARHEMYPHNSEYDYICDHIKIFLSSLAPSTNLSDKIIKKRGSGMVSIQLGPPM